MVIHRFVQSQVVDLLLSTKINDVACARTFLVKLRFSSFNFYDVHYSKSSPTSIRSKKKTVFISNGELLVVSQQQPHNFVRKKKKLSIDMTREENAKKKHNYILYILCILAPPPQICRPKYTGKKNNIYG